MLVPRTGAFLTHALVDILSIGSVYALLAFGYALTYGVTGTFNFGLAAVFGIGAWAAAAMLAAGYPLAWAVAGGIAGGSVASALIDRLALWPWRMRLAGALGGNAPVIAAAAALAALLPLLSDRAAFTSTTLRRTIDRLPSLHAGPTTIPASLWIAVSACVLGLVLGYALMRGLRVGAGMRAVADNPAGARAAGVDAELVIAQAALVAGAFGALAGIAFASLGAREIGALAGTDVQLSAFAVLALGGLASLPGSVLAAFAVAALEVAATTLAPSLHVGPIVAALAVLAFVLLPRGMLPKTALRPTGLTRPQ